MYIPTQLNKWILILLKFVKRSVSRVQSYLKLFINLDRSLLCIRVFICNDKSDILSQTPPQRNVIAFRPLPFFKQLQRSSYIWNMKKNGGTRWQVFFPRTLHVYCIFRLETKQPCDMICIYLAARWVGKFGLERRFKTNISPLPSIAYNVF